MDIVKRLREGRSIGTDLRWEVTAEHREAADEIERLRELKTPASANLLNMTKALLEEAEAECNRLRAALAEAVGILDGDGEYPATARRFREALSEGK